MSPESPCALDGVAIRYGGTEVCRDVTLAVEPGEVALLLGRNGAGKTSLVRCLLGQQRPGSGRARLFGADSWRTRRRAMARTGVRVFLRPRPLPRAGWVTTRGISCSLWASQRNVGLANTPEARKTTRIAKPAGLGYRRRTPP